MTQQAEPLMPADRTWTPRDVAAFLRVSIRQLNDIRHEDETFPKPAMAGSLPRWAPPLVMAWVGWPVPSGAAVTSVSSSGGTAPGTAETEVEPSRHRRTSTKNSAGARPVHHV